jgi:hypothetical protein
MVSQLLITSKRFMYMDLLLDPFPRLQHQDIYKQLILKSNQLLVIEFPMLLVTSSIPLAYRIHIYTIKFNLAS